MTNNFVLSKTNIFDNPFDDVNANNIDPQRILSLWCTPFRNTSTQTITENKFRTQKLPIIIQGSRGTGKTTILKYYSYPLLKERAKSNKKPYILNQILEEKSIGFYFRCDDSFVNTFESIFRNQSQEQWLAFFEHYLELQFCSQIIAVIIDIQQEVEQKCEFEKDFIRKLKNTCTLPALYSIESISAIKGFILDEISYINKFKNDSIFTEVTFSPSALLSLYSLSWSLISAVDKLIENMSKVMYLILVDEFENMTEEIQRFFNTKIKFAHERISLRIGRRSEGNITTATVNETEYLRLNNDYFLIEINKDKDLTSEKEYFLEIAKKRLATSPALVGSSIVDILGDKEDLDSECINICKYREDHLDIILSEKLELKENVELRKEIISIIKNPQNPIAETLNALWVIREKGDSIDAANRAKTAMQGYFNKNNCEGSRKYKNDYTNKYRYSITALLASLYKKKKMYYGFNAVVHLSDGNTRTFLNICRSIISDAMFYEKDSFLKTKTISKETQNRAICEFSRLEFESICSIIKYGLKIRNFILNVGNIFSEYHKDRKARYPETTQFTFDKLDLDEPERLVLEVAESWSMIIKRTDTQRVSAGISQKGDLYYINRAFSPLFGISYRIRGGVNITFTKEEIEEMMITLNTLKKLPGSKKIKREKKASIYDTKQENQMTLFDLEDLNDE